MWGMKETQIRVIREDAGFQVRVGWKPKLARGGDRAGRLDC